MLALDSAAVVLLVFDVVVGRGAAVIAAAAVLVFLFALWGAVPLVERAASRKQDQADSTERRTSGNTSDP
jgi:hypothetical protein